MVLEMENSQVMYALGMYVCVCCVMWGDEDVYVWSWGHEEEGERVEGGGMNAITSREWSFLCVLSEMLRGTIPLN